MDTGRSLNWKSRTLEVVRTPAISMRGTSTGINRERERGLVSNVTKRTCRCKFALNDFSDRVPARAFLKDRRYRCRRGARLLSRFHRYRGFARYLP